MAHNIKQIPAFCPAIQHSDVNRKERRESTLGITCVDFADHIPLLRVIPPVGIEIESACHIMNASGGDRAPADFS